MHRMRWTVAAIALNGVAVGATLDQAIKQLPARHHIGTSAYLTYVRAADLRNGLRWYPALGLTTAAVSITAAVAGLRDAPNMTASLAAITVAAATAAHLAATTQAAPIMLGLR